MMSGRSTSPVDLVFDGLTTRELMAEHFPMLLSSGIPDIGLTVHSHFLTFLASAGQSQGFSAVAECPIWWARDSGLGDVRADSVWFEKHSGEASFASSRPRIRL